MAQMVHAGADRSAERRVVPRQSKALRRKTAACPRLTRSLGAESAVPTPGADAGRGDAVDAALVRAVLVVAEVVVAGGRQLRAVASAAASPPRRTVWVGQ